MPEIEIKLRVADLGGLLATLDGLGWSSQGRKHERNELFDTSALDLLRNDKLLRVRATAGKTIVTVKGPSLSGSRHKVRDEHETEASDAVALGRIFETIGFEPIWVYEKYRTKFTRVGEPGVIEVDEMPIGNFVELEGPPDWIDRTASELGYLPADYITFSYRDLFLAWKEESGSGLRDMVFED